MEMLAEELYTLMKLATPGAFKSYIMIQNHENEIDGVLRVLGLIQMLRAFLGVQRTRGFLYLAIPDADEPDLAMPWITFEDWDRLAFQTSKLLFCTGLLDLGDAQVFATPWQERCKTQGRPVPQLQDNQEHQQQQHQQQQQYRPQQQQKGGQQQRQKPRWVKKMPEEKIPEEKIPEEKKDRPIAAFWLAKSADIKPWQIIEQAHPSKTVIVEVKSLVKDKATTLLSKKNLRQLEKRASIGVEYIILHVFTTSPEDTVQTARTKLASLLANRQPNQPYPKLMAYIAARRFLFVVSHDPKVLLTFAQAHTAGHQYRHATSALKLVGSALQDLGQQVADMKEQTDLIPHIKEQNDQMQKRLDKLLRHYSLDDSE